MSKLTNKLTHTQKIEITKNKEHIENRNKKFKLYALFQFFSTTTIFLISIALGLVVYLGVKDNLSIDKHFFESEFKIVMSFDSSNGLHIFTSILAYDAFLTWGISMIIAIMQFKNNQRSMFDTAFLFFFVVPLLSNVIALFSQISETVYRIPATHVDRYATKIEYINELKSFIEEEKKNNKKSS